MSHLDDPDEYKRNPLFSHHEPSNYVPFYVALALCTAFAIFLCVLNIFFCCISKHKDYWKDTNTGNRWILPIWVKTPAGQPPVDITELEQKYWPQVLQYEAQKKEQIESVYESRVSLPTSAAGDYYMEYQKRESDI
ncbi:uncharacterized protein LOC103513672 isoform X1 [Diaphorina citri]|uniref:Uncharacterized protein LOC103513672 isoform X1 n=2 Tax=Diaphorina citri TaxID=121845 RepID=A0A1S3D8Q0_DIACI|nr:uncharacterized protein LOC103513672 isoform X2 [Diaphorina citri]XP_017301411.1 uncharacterized protein LOC103513672 isoform X1 [Diaphorina citri]KAI5701031.1 hypothetical protein M8J75_005403 [Diaphorina citri]KAI5729702.1 hypothetical protein M8J76_005583 [Diaphorina citri]KAI5735437.1 hypothetical protein M8J77_018309 [Diaphorina citri]